MPSQLRPVCRIPAGQDTRSCPVGSAGDNAGQPDAGDLGPAILIAATEYAFKAVEAGRNYQDAWREFIDPKLAALTKKWAAEADADDSDDDDDDDWDASDDGPDPDSVFARADARGKDDMSQRDCNCRADADPRDDEDDNAWGARVMRAATASAIARPSANGRPAAAAAPRGDAQAPAGDDEDAARAAMRARSANQWRR